MAEPILDLLNLLARALVTEHESDEARRARQAAGRRAEMDRFAQRAAESAAEKVRSEEQNARRAEESTELARETWRMRILEAREDLRQEWASRTHDIFPPMSDDDEYRSEMLGSGGFRQAARQRLTNVTRGISVELVGGDVADTCYGWRYRLQLGPDEPPQSFTLWPGGAVTDWVSDAGMMALSKLFNAEPAIGIPTTRPLTLARKKVIYRGDAGEARWKADRAAFLAPYFPDQA